MNFQKVMKKFFVKNSNPFQFASYIFKNKYLFSLEMKKHLLDLTITENRFIGESHILMKLTSNEKLPEVVPGQFVEVRIDHTPTVFLRRPISINFVDYKTNELWLLIQLVGDGTKHLSTLKAGDVVNIIMPLGNGFSKPTNARDKVLLVGGGVGIAPLLMLGAELKRDGFQIHHHLRS